MVSLLDRWDVHFGRVVVQTRSSKVELFELQLDYICKQLINCSRDILRINKHTITGTHKDKVLFEAVYLYKLLDRTRDVFNRYPPANKLDFYMSCDRIKSFINKELESGALLSTLESFSKRTTPDVINTTVTTILEDQDLRRSDIIESFITVLDKIDLVHCFALELKLNLLTEIVESNRFLFIKYIHILEKFKDTIDVKFLSPIDYNVITQSNILPSIKKFKDYLILVHNIPIDDEYSIKPK